MIERLQNQNNADEEKSDQNGSVTRRGFFGVAAAAGLGGLMTFPSETSAQARAEKITEVERTLQLAEFGAGVFTSQTLKEFIDENPEYGKEGVTVQLESKASRFDQDGQTFLRFDFYVSAGFVPPDKSEKGFAGQLSLNQNIYAFGVPWDKGPSTILEPTLISQQKPLLKKALKEHLESPAVQSLLKDPQ